MAHHSGNFLKFQNVAQVLNDEPLMKWKEPQLHILCSIIKWVIYDSTLRLVQPLKHGQWWVPSLVGVTNETVIRKLKLVLHFCQASSGQVFLKWPQTILPWQRTSWMPRYSGSVWPVSQPNKLQDSMAAFSLGHCIYSWDFGGTAGYKDSWGEW